MEIRTKAYAYLVASLLIGSFTPALLVLTNGSNIAELLLLAALLSIPIGFALVGRSGKQKEIFALTGDRKKLLYTALTAVLFYVPYLYGIAYAEKFISSSLAIVIFRLNPLLMLLFIPALLHERLSKKQVFALFLAFLGIAIGISGGNLLSVFSNPDVPILTFLILLTLGYALANVLFKSRMMDSEIFVTSSGVVLSLFFGLLFLATGAQATPLSGTDIAIIVYIAVTNIFSFYMYSHALKRLKTTMVTNVFSASTFLTFMWSFLLFGTAVKAYYLAIAVLTVVGVYIQLSDKIGGSYLARKGSRLRNFLIFDVTGAFSNTGETAISAAIKNGGRVLALKLEGKHENTVNALTESGEHTNVFTDKHLGITQEADFVKEILGAGEGELVVMKAGDPSDGERFFEALSDRLETGEGQPLGRVS